MKMGSHYSPEELFRFDTENHHLYSDEYLCKLDVHGGMTS